MRATVMMAVLVVAVACEIADDDRCPKDMVYLSEHRVCACADGGVYDVPSDSCVPMEMDTDSDTQADAGGDGGNGGFGESCLTDDDCADNEVADFCVLDPLTPGAEGYCSFEDCVASDCPDGWRCCECQQLLGWTACLDDEYAATAETYGCTCSP